MAEVECSEKKIFKQKDPFLFSDNNWHPVYYNFWKFSLHILYIFETAWNFVTKF